MLIRRTLPRSSSVMAAPTVDTEQQRMTLETAYLDDGVRPAPRVVERAARGELRCDGEPVAPFETSEDSVSGTRARLGSRLFTSKAIVS